MSKRKGKKKTATQGLGYFFHGSFKNEAKAKAKAKLRKGFVLKRTLPRIGRRYIIMTEGTPF